MELLSFLQEVVAPCTEPEHGAIFILIELRDSLSQWFDEIPLVTTRAVAGCNLCSSCTAKRDTAGFQLRFLSPRMVSPHKSACVHTVSTFSFFGQL